MKAARHNAFTLVECLVVIAIIGILIAMLLPAVQSAREGARRTSCLNNLSQLSIAVQNYEATHEAYPAGVVDAKGPILNQAQGFHHSWIIQILPYMEEANIYRHIDQTVGVYAPQNKEPRQMTLERLRCPSEYGSMSAGIGGSNYAACHHDVEAPIDANNNGAFFLNSFLRYDDIKDGAAHTIFLGEKRIDASDLGWMSGTRATLRNTGTPINGTPVVAAAWAVGSAGGELPQVPVMEPLLVPPGAEGDGAPAAGGDDAAAAESNSPNDVAQAGPEPAAPVVDPAAPPSGVATVPVVPPVPGAAAVTSPLYVGGFGSAHQTIANFAFGDGHVRGLNDSIDLKVLQQLGHRADGKMLNAIDP